MLKTDNVITQQKFIATLSSSGASVEMTPVGFEPTQLALVELESTPLDHSGKVSVIVV